MKTLTVSFLLCVFLGTSIEAMDPPEVLWAKTIFPDQLSIFYDVQETSDGDFIIAGILPVDSSCAVLLDGDGYFIWAGGGPWYSQVSYSVEPLPDGGFIVTGRCKEYFDSSWGLMLAHLDADGDYLCGRVYDYPNSVETGYCVLPLPDGGYAVCGEIDPSSGMDQAWVLRTDANGDTLWTREWGWTYNDMAKRILYVDGSLSVLMHGRLQSTTGGPHLVQYNLDGDLNWETDIPDLAGEYGEDMYYTPDDGCYTMITGYGPILAHVTSQGEVLWTGYIPGYGFPYGTSVSGTMDGGTVIGGYNEPDPDCPWQEFSGMVGRFDSDGNSEWGYYVSEEDCHEINCVRQLSQGGYIAAGRTAGNQGLLIRYAPETGIGEAEPSPSTVLLHGPVPNPSHGAFSISFDLPTDGQVALSVYDLSGRRVADLYQGAAEAGIHSVGWDSEDLPSGCYVVVLRTDEGMDSSTCVLLR